MLMERVIYYSRFAKNVGRDRRNEALTHIPILTGHPVPVVHRLGALLDRRSKKMTDQLLDLVEAFTAFIFLKGLLGEFWKFLAEWKKLPRDQHGTKDLETLHT